MTIASTLQRLRMSLLDSAGTIVFGMVFGVAATTTSTKTVLIAGASGAVAAAVSMMAGAYLDVETTRDEMKAKRELLQADAARGSASLPARLAKAGLTPQQSAALTAAVQSDQAALGGLLIALQGEPDAPSSPWEQALWMLFADFLAAAVPILPFVFVPIAPARIVSGVVTTALLVALGVGRARLAKRSIARTVMETVSIGLTAALAGVAIGVLIERFFTP